MVTMLLENGADANLAAKDGTTALKAVSRYGDKEIIDMLIAKGAKQVPVDPAK